MLISMRSFPARTFAWLQRKLSDLHSYPTAQEMAGVSDERLSSLRQESGASLARIIFLLLSLGAFCLVALQSPDRHLLSPAAEISLPFVGSSVSFLGFVVFGPLLLFGVWGYLHVLITYHRKLGQELARRALAPIPTISEVSHPFFQLLFFGAYIPLVPFILLWFTYKSMAVPGLGVFVFLWTLLVIKDQKEARFAYGELLGWIAQEDPRTLEDAQFQVKVARKYLMLYAIRRESIPAELALKVLKQLYGPGWEQLLKSLPKKEPFFKLSPEQERRWRLTQKGALRLIEK